MTACSMDDRLFSVHPGSSLDSSLGAEAELLDSSGGEDGRNMDLPQIDLESGIDNVAIDLGELEEYILHGNSNKIFYDMLPESPPDSGSEHHPLSPSSQSILLSPASEHSIGEECFYGKSNPPNQSILLHKDPFLNSQIQDSSSTLKVSSDLDKVDYSRPLELLEQGRVLHGKSNSLPLRAGHRVNIPARASNRYVTEQSEPKLTGTAGRSDLDPRRMVTPIMLENRVQNKGEERGVENVKLEPIGSPNTGTADITVVPPVRKRARREVYPGSTPSIKKELAPQPPQKLEGEPRDGYGTVPFHPFQQETWTTMTGSDYSLLPPPVLKVCADKGFNYSASDESLIVQKKNHFQLTCHVSKEGCPSFVKSGSRGIYPSIDYLQLNFYGVKKEAPAQRIQIEQSQADRSKRKFFPIRLSFRGDQPLRVSVGRLHFSETTLNNMRKRGKPNPDQRYFQLVVSVEAVLSSSETVNLVSLSTERIIVRASNPGLFECEQTEGVWNKDGDTLYHIGKVGVGTEVSPETLTVQGNVQVAGQILHPSDRRIKQDISVIDSKVQLKNVQNIQVVKYRYKPEYLDNFPAADREKMGSLQTGVLAQEVARVIPEAVHTAGQLDLDSGHSIPDMLIVNKDRLFLENIGAVRELSKMTDSLGHRIDELESHTLKLTDLRSYNSSKSNTSLTSSTTSRSRSLFKNRAVQTSILVSLAVIAISLFAMASVYIAGYVQNRIIPVQEGLFNDTLEYRTLWTENVTVSQTPSIRRTTQRFRQFSKHQPRYLLTVNPTPIGQPAHCNGSYECKSYCSIGNQSNPSEKISTDSRAQKKIFPGNSDVRIDPDNSQSAKSPDITNIISDSLVPDIPGDLFQRQNRLTGPGMKSGVRSLQPTKKDILEPPVTADHKVLNITTESTASMESTSTTVASVDIFEKLPTEKYEENEISDNLSGEFEVDYNFDEPEVFFGNDYTSEEDLIQTSLIGGQETVEAFANEIENNEENVGDSSPSMQSEDETDIEAYNERDQFVEKQINASRDAMNTMENVIEDSVQSILGVDHAEDSNNMITQNVDILIKDEPEIKLNSSSNGVETTTQSVERELITDEEQRKHESKVDDTQVKESVVANSDGQKNVEINEIDSGSNENKIPDYVIGEFPDIHASIDNDKQVDSFISLDTKRTGSEKVSTAERVDTVDSRTPDIDKSSNTIRNAVVPQDNQQKTKSATSDNKNKAKLDLNEKKEKDMRKGADQDPSYFEKTELFGNKRNEIPTFQKRISSSRTSNNKHGSDNKETEISRGTDVHDAGDSDTTAEITNETAAELNDTYFDSNELFDTENETAYNESNRSGSGGKSMHPSDNMNLIVMEEDLDDLEGLPRNKRLTDVHAPGQHKIVRRFSSRKDFLKRIRRAANSNSCQHRIPNGIRIQVETSVGLHNITEDYCTLCDDTNLTCTLPVSRHLSDMTVRLKISSENSSIISCQSSTSTSTACPDELKPVTGRHVCFDVDLFEASVVRLRSPVTSTRGLTDICSGNLDSTVYQILVRTGRSCSNQII